MAKCKNCKNIHNLSNEGDGNIRKWCHKIFDCPDTECDRECQYYEPQTNADRILAMTNEELAEFLPIVFDCMCQPTDKCREIILNRGECVKTNECALRWLQKEAEE